mmetsp:Transcript_487/g.692  ORF Transcript_487/g.692 Transcript_487/m.692 type:complete len:106 (+) Transcript_487:222-539(+)
MKLIRWELLRWQESTQDEWRHVGLIPTRVGNVGVCALANSLKMVSKMLNKINLNLNKLGNPGLVEMNFSIDSLHLYGSFMILGGQWCSIHCCRRKSKKEAADVRN